MDLETLLPALRSLRDLPRLVAVLGHQPLWEEVPAGQNGATGRSSVFAVGKTAELPWLALEAEQPDHAAKKLARRMSRVGRPCIVLALALCERSLAVAVGMYGCPVIRVDLAHPSRQGLASLARLVATSDGGALAFAARAADALGAEPVGPRFFRQFRTTLDSLVSGLPGSMPSEDRHSLALLQLTRVLFLYFVQTKGWLAGRDRFMAEEVDRCLQNRRKIHRDLLRPLFFGTLNQPASSRSRAAAAFGPIPFLNGGLFEPHALERRFKFDIPDDLWRNAFDELFERFHFTVAENTAGGSVAPDMLGRVFEGVMSPDLRHVSGTFYTPAAVVDGLLNAGIGAFLAIRLRCGDAEAERRFLDPDPKAAHALSAITLLDPAVGSGAFLLGALERLHRVHPGPLSDQKRAVLQRNLFGVDLSAAAVRLAELRLWLAVIADDPAEHPTEVRPLPNLDCLIRQGDSLSDPIDHELRGALLQLETAGELPAIRRALIAATGVEKKSLVRRLRAVEGRALHQSLEAAVGRNRAELADCLDEARGPNLFGQRRGLDAELRCRVAELRRRGRLLQGARRRLSRDGELPWFHYQSQFADVFAKGGFDLLVGNPPWLRSEDVAATLRARLSQRYRWWRASGAGYRNKPDIAVAFLERSFELAAPGGVVAMLVPAKIASARYAALARHGLASTTTLHAVVDLTSGAGAAFDATVYPMAIVSSKATPPAVHEVRTTLAVVGGAVVPQAQLAGGGPWILVKSELREILSGLRARHPRLGEMFVCHLGLKTGANGIFLNPPEHLESELLRWALRGRDVVAFGCQPEVRLLWTHDQSGRPRSTLPDAAARYLWAHESELRARKDFTRGPIWTVFRVRTAIARYRVVWADLARKLAAAALTTAGDLRLVPLNSCYVVAVRSSAAGECLAACLNSTWLRAAAQLSAVPAAGGYSRFNARTIAELPLPAAATNDPLLSRLAREARTGADVQKLLDSQLAKHLGISKAAQNALRSVVDGAAHRC